MAAHHKWGSRSLTHRATLHPDLVKLVDRVLFRCPHDVTIIEGHRSDERQAEMLATGMSTLGPGKSKHNRSPSEAVDMAPILSGRIPWEDKESFVMFGGFVMGIAHEMGIKIRWGGDWDSDWNVREHSLFDGPHFELIGD